MTEFTVASPCINVCRLGPDGLCKGCFRTREEIVGWRAANDDERREIIAAAEERSQKEAS
ncbi:DUF1289 domain-containing protein [Terasakiella sp. A23]|uniref:DUF1289 domain-containing protein n=1 Tax=Terasakiella sp. FCG-A23 TaxID=3080561 RepID=UPI002952C5EA|nr:DUF1289 domain-containing protein [Terasakiella sp. A23]MDV7337996.1 DUF1289 domain-containing protein [Terasakiella sp. A23]